MRKSPGAGGLEAAQPAALLGAPLHTQNVRAVPGRRVTSASPHESIEDMSGGGRGAGLGTLDGSATDLGGRREVVLGKPRGPAQGDQVLGEVGERRALARTGTGGGREGHGELLPAGAGAYRGLHEDGHEPPAASGHGEGGGRSEREEESRPVPT